MADLSVFGKFKTLGDYQQEGDKNALETALGIQKIQQQRSGRDLPAAIQVANEIQSAMQRGDGTYAQLLIDSAKIDPKGTIREFGLDRSVQAAPSSMQSGPIPTGPVKGLAGQGTTAAQDLGSLPPLPAYNEADPKINLVTPAVDTVQATGSIKPRPGIENVYATEAAAKERAKLQQQLELEPTIAAATKQAGLRSEYNEKGFQNLVKVQRDLAGQESRKVNLDRIYQKSLAAADSAFTTGFTGSLLSAARGSPAFDLAENVKTLRATAAFDTLQNMRNNSPTGGALRQRIRS